MDLDELRLSPVGELVPIRGYDPRFAADYEHFAFVPTPLPDTVELEQQTWINVSEAMQALGRLDQAGTLIPNPGLLRRPLLRREAVSTSALEGTHAAFADVLEADVVEDAPKSPELREVLNYVAAAEHAITDVQNGRPVSVGLLRECHAILLRSTGNEASETGKVRETPVVIGPEGCAIVDARFVPPPPGERLEDGLHAWESWMNERGTLPAVVRAALAHYQFETLHPFHDGNGRLGRLAVLLQLIGEGALNEPLLEVSPWFERRRRDYQQHLYEVSRSGEWDPWVRFFCTAIRDQAISTTERVNRLLSYQADARDRLRSANVRGVAVDVANDLIGRPVITPTSVAKTYGITYPAANSAVRRLVELGLVEEKTGRRYGRIFMADGVYSILQN